MPYSPDKVKALASPAPIPYDDIDRGFVNHAGGDWYKDRTYAILMVELSEKEKKEVEQTYLAAGWSKVEVKNSSENGERPGLCQVTVWY